MKVAQINTYGNASIIEINDVEKPILQPGRVLVKIHATSINPFDVKLRQGMMAQAIPLKFPFTLGSDFAGVVSDIGEGVSSFSVGNKVYGSANVLSGGTGAFAEFAVVPEGLISLMPHKTDFKQAAAAVLTGVSAIQALLEHINLQPGQKILIHGGAGGIGTMAIQIAKAIGAFVATTVKGEEIEYVRKLGADYVIDYNTDQFELLINEYDAVFDTVGGQVFENSFKALKKGGALVSMVAKDLPHRQAGEKTLAEQYGVTAISQFSKVTTERLQKLAEFIDHKGVKPHLDKVFSFDRIREAFEYQESGDVQGKVVLEII